MLYPEDAKVEENTRQENACTVAPGSMELSWGRTCSAWGTWEIFTGQVTLHVFTCGGWKGVLRPVNSVIQLTHLPAVRSDVTRKS